MIEPEDTQPLAQGDLLDEHFEMLQEAIAELAKSKASFDLEHRHLRRSRILIAWTFLTFSGAMVAAAFAEGRLWDWFAAALWAVVAAVSFYGLHKVPDKWSE